MSSLHLAYYGDDFTGSTDALEFLTRAGVRTVLFTRPPSAGQIAGYPGLGAVGVAGFTRALAPDAMEQELRPAFAALAALAPRHVHYKVCSTFDSSPTVGSIGRAIEIGADVFGGRFVPLVVGAPPLGRYCAFGNLFARFGIGSSGAIHRLDRHPAMSRHPVTPADESDLRLHLGRQTKKRVGLFDLLMLGQPELERRATLERIIGGGAEIVLFDVLETEHLERVGGLLDPLGGAKPLFSVGSSGVEMALGARWQAAGILKSPAPWKHPGAAEPLLVISGSCSPVTIAQIAWALRNGFVDVGIDPLAPAAEARAAVDQAIGHLRAGRHVIVHSRPERSQVDRAAGANGAAVSASELGATLGRIGRDAVAATGIRRLMVAGGDTSSYAARALGIEAIEMIAPLAPGAPLCRATAPASPIDGIEVNFKGGQVGAEDYFGAVANGNT
ncbi:MAG TPA: four-carbon acid sugar kinase family protein [Opitutaceae bacterium]|nr:four-carbon acid sugar kinase family protein [Opitutaceae bacterium]